MPGAPQKNTQDGSRNARRGRHVLSLRTLTSILGAVVAGAVGLWGWDSVNNPSHNGSEGGGSSTESSSGSSGGPGSSSSGGSHKGASGSIPACNANQLPDQARVVVDDIKSGGPFDYPQKDGSHFGNYENALPHKKNNYYRESTVDEDKTDHSRGPARIITGGSTATHPDVWYYTSDHYSSFCEMQEN